MTSQCTKSNYTPEESKNNLQTIKHMMGDRISQTCMTAYAEGSAEVPLANAQVSAGASSGCGPIAIMSNAYTDLMTSTTCMINSLQNTTRTTTNTTNTYSLNCDNCIFLGKFNVNQKISGKLNIVYNLSEQVKAQIENNIKATIKQLQTNLQDQKQTAGAVVPGATSVQISDVSLQTYMDSQTISETVNTFATELDFENSAVINFRNTVFSEDYVFDQNIAIDAAISNMVSKIFEGIVKNTKTTEVIQEQVSVQKSESVSGSKSGGIGIVAGAIIGILICGLLAYYVCKNNVIYFLLVLILFFISLLFFFLWKYSDRPELTGLNVYISSLGGPDPKTTILICSIIVWIICCIVFGYGTYQKIVGCKKINQVLNNAEKQLNNATNQI